MMFKCHFVARGLLASILILGTSTAVFSAPKGPPFFDVGQPARVGDLPPGQFRKSLEDLSPASRSRALGQLQRVSFPGSDTALLRVTPRGDLWFAESGLLVGSDQGLAVPSLSGPEMAGGSDVPAWDVFRLHSRPGSSNVLYLDFDGAVLEGTTWNSSNPRIEALPFDPDGNDAVAMEPQFTSSELNRIHEIWHRVAEDFAAFDIDVTTEAPSSITATTAWVLITESYDASGYRMPSSSAGGIASLNVFGTSNYGSYYPALVYYNNLSSADPGNPTYVAEICSHEFGHHLGLSHDGRSGETYYRGHGEGLVSWAPIMGAAFDKNVSQWSRGDYAGANNTQDDLAIILGKLGHAGDDHGDQATTASSLLVDTDGDILVSNPELDPDNLLTANKGIIGGAGDVDWFTFETSAGTSQLTLTAAPAWTAFRRDGQRGANLDLEMTLLDESLQVFASEDRSNDTAAGLDAFLPAGRYYIRLQRVGNQVNSDYPEYASQGMYFLEGALVGNTGEDTQSPSPELQGWSSLPAQTGASTISMTAATASDESGTVKYFFTCVAGGAGCVDSGWQTARNYSISGVSPDTYYAFKVQARDVYGNANTSSGTTGLTTEPPPPNQPPVAVASYLESSAIFQKGKRTDVRLHANNSSDADGVITAWAWFDAQGAMVGTSKEITVSLAAGSHAFTLQVTDDGGLSANDNLTVIVCKSSCPTGDSDDPVDSGGGGGGNGGGKGKKPPKG